MFLASRVVVPLLVVASARALDFDNDSLRQAVDAWLDDPVAAADTYGRINDWRTWSVSDMSRLFQGATDFNEDISGWDTSSVTDFSHVFAGAASFNADLSKWDVRQVTDFSHAFYGASSFTGESLNTWNTDSAQSFEQMFLGASEFVGPENIGSWNTSSVTTMYAMFFHARSFNRSVSAWDMTGVKFNDQMFEGASSFSQSICWPKMNPYAKCFQCFCGSGDAYFDTSTACPASVHPSILAYARACSPNDVLEELVENQVFTRPEESQIRGGFEGATGSFVQGLAGLPMLSDPSVDQALETKENDGGSGASATELGARSPSDELIIAGAQRETSSTSSLRTGGGVTPLLALILALACFCC